MFKNNSYIVIPIMYINLVNKPIPVAGISEDIMTTADRLSEK